MNNDVIYLIKHFQKTFFFKNKVNFIKKFILIL